jgi:ABC-2 type transport system ATP-binding protein
VIQFQNTSKTYRSLLGSTVHAVEDFSLQIADGEVLGIAGPNGAGKSTLIAMLLGYLRPTSGSVTIYGQSPRDYIERNGIGYVSELVKIHPRWRTETALARYAMLSGIPDDQIAARVDAVIEQLGLSEHRDKKFKALSKGNAQRLGIAQALLRDHQIIVFDEPTHGLDPVWTQRFRDIVNSLRRQDRIIIIASHNLDELQRLSDRVAIIDHGRLQRLVSTRFDQAATDSSMTYRLQVASGAEHIVTVFPNAMQVNAGEFDITVSGLSDLNGKVAELIGRGVLISGVTPARSALEEHFRAAVGE